MGVVAATGTEFEKGYLSGLRDAKEKILSLTQPQSINNDIPDNDVRL